MAIITDADLLSIEPGVFVAATAAATPVLSAGDGAINGTTLSSAASDFLAAGIEAGHVIVAAGEPLEVVASLDETSLTVSRARPRGATTAVNPQPGTDLAIEVWTFARLIALAQAWVLGALGVDDAQVILNVPAIGRLIALRTVREALAIAAAGDPENASLPQMATLYRRRFEEVRQQTLALLDTDGDGVADATCRIAVAMFGRA